MCFTQVTLQSHISVSLGLEYESSCPPVLVGEHFLKTGFAPALLVQQVFGPYSHEEGIATESLRVFPSE